MGDWHVHLRNILNSTDLEHLAVFDKKLDCLTNTDDFLLRACEIQHVQLVLNAGRTGEAFHVAARAYKVKELRHFASLYGEEISLSEEKSAVYVRHSDRFIVLGIGRPNKGSCHIAMDDLLAALVVAGESR